MSERACCVCGIVDPPHVTRGRCRQCYVYLWRHGHDRPAAVALRGTWRRCAAPGCRQVVRRLRAGLCPMHYQRRRHTGSLVLD